jgi:hypothetical protein
LIHRHPFNIITWEGTVESLDSNATKVGSALRTYKRRWHRVSQMWDFSTEVAQMVQEMPRERGVKGLRSRSRRFTSSPSRKVFLQQELWIVDLRCKRRLGARRIQNELKSYYGCTWTAIVSFDGSDLLENPSRMTTLL